MKYNFEVQWKQGTDDIIADALSKNPMYAAIQDYDDDDEVIFQNGIRKSNYHSISLDQLKQEVLQNTVFDILIDYISKGCPSFDKIDNITKPFFKIKDELCV